MNDRETRSTRTVNEAITPDLVLDSEGKPLLEPGRDSRPHTPRRLNLGPLLGTALLAVLLVAGFTFFGVFLALLMAFWILKGIWNLLGLPSARTARRRSSYPVYFKIMK
ncbi:MAG: hypothetical protein NDJ89_10665 [Oligoflexia bacterium]|nr:hypothetical protein [Oligoflexia bacterium]